MAQKFYEREFECVRLNGPEYNFLNMIRDYSKSLPLKLGVVEKISSASCPGSVMEVYESNIKDFKNLVLKATEKGDLEYLLSKNIEDFFKKLDQNLEVEFFMGWVTRDGGEVRGPFDVYNPDGSLKEGYVVVQYS